MAVVGAILRSQRIQWEQLRLAACRLPYPLKSGGRQEPLKVFEVQHDGMVAVVSDACDEPLCHRLGLIQPVRKREIVMEVLLDRRFERRYPDPYDDAPFQDPQALSKDPPQVQPEIGSRKWTDVDIDPAGQRLASRSEMKPPAVGHATRAKAVLRGRDARRDAERHMNRTTYAPVHAVVPAVVEPGAAPQHAVQALRDAGRIASSVASMLERSVVAAYR